MPESNLHLYINIYTIVGGCGALVFFLIYSHAKFALHIKKIGFGLLALYVVGNLLFDRFWVSVFIYPLIIIYNDYIVTQSEILRGRNIYRLIIILSAFPFVFFQNQFEIIFQMRVLLLAVILFFYAIKIDDVTVLQVESTWKYIFFNYTFYYLPLLLIANISLLPSALKTWYIFAQGGLVVYLKYLDYALRKNHVVSHRLNFLILLFAVGAPILPVCLFPSIIGLIAYFIGLAGLIYSKRYIKFSTI